MSDIIGDSTEPDGGWDNPPDTEKTMTKPTETQINVQLDLAYNQVAKGSSQCPGNSYEEGVAAALDWVNGIIEDKPMEDE